MTIAIRQPQALKPAASDFYSFRCAHAGCRETAQISAALPIAGARLFAQRILGWRLVWFGAVEGERLCCPEHGRAAEKRQADSRFAAFLTRFGIRFRDGASA